MIMFCLIKTWEQREIACPVQGAIVQKVVSPWVWVGTGWVCRVRGRGWFAGDAAGDTDGGSQEMRSQPSKHQSMRTTPVTCLVTGQSS